MTPGRSSASGGGRLYLDAMNCAEWFFGGGASPECHRSAVGAMPGRVKEFMAAAAASGFDQVAAFIDAARVTDEAREKWRSRRLKEVRGYRGHRDMYGRASMYPSIMISPLPFFVQVEREERRMPLCLSSLLGEALASCGATVHYSLEADNDDTLAAYAQVT